MRKSFSILFLLIMLVQGSMCWAQNGYAVFEDQATLEQKIRNELSEILQKSLGADVFVAASAKADVPRATSKTPKADEAELTYSPTAWSLSLDGPNKPKIIVTKLTVTIVTKRNLENEEQKSVKDMVESLYSMYPLSIKYQTVQLDSFKSKEKLAEANADSINLNNIVWFVISFLALAGVVFGLSLLGVNIGKIAGALTNFGGNLILLQKESQQRKDQSLPAPSLKNLPPPPSMELKQIERAQKLFKEFLNTKPLIFSRVMSGESDKALLNLKAIGPFLSEIEKRHLKALLGMRIQVLAQNSDEEISAQDSFAWLKSFVERLNSEEILSDATFINQLPPERINQILSLKKDDLKLLWNDPSLSRDSLSWKLLFEALGPETISELLSDSEIEDWQRFMADQGRTAVAPTDVSNLSVIFQKLDEINKKNGAAAFLTSSSAINSKQIRAIILSLERINLKEEHSRVEKMKKLYPELFAALRNEYWSVDVLSDFAEKERRAFVSGFNPEESSMLIYLLKSLGMAELSETIVAELPEGLKKEIVVSTLAKFLRENPAADEVASITPKIRASLKEFHIKAKEGKFQLIGRPDRSSSEAA